MCILFTYRPPNPLLLCMLHAAANSYAAIGHVARVLVYISRLPLTDWVCPWWFHTTSNLFSSTPVFAT
jgi:hypothetical protein